VTQNGAREFGKEAFDEVEPGAVLGSKSESEAIRGLERAKLSRRNEVAKATDYMLKRIDVFTRFLEDGRICLSNNAAERELRRIALGRKSWLFAGSDEGASYFSSHHLLINPADFVDDRQAGGS
jgi:Transposase IS66 family